MRVERLELENMLSYEKLDLELPTEGSIVFVGANGAGKSTILDAVLFALFRKNTRGRSNEVLVRKGASYARVAVTFSVDGRRFKVTRRISTARARQEIGDTLHEYVDGKWRLLAKGREVSKEISRILGVDEKLFTTAVYARQGEIAALLEMTPAERKKLLASLLGLSELEKAFERMRDVINHFRARAERLSGEVSVKPRIEKGLREAEESLKAKKEEAVTVERALQSAASELREAEAEFSRYEELSKRYRALRERLAAIETRLEEAERALAKAQAEYLESVKAEEEAERLEEAVRELEAVREYSGLVEERKALKAAIESLERELSKCKELLELSSQLESLEMKLAEREEQLSRLKDELSRLEREVWEAERAANELESVKEDLGRVGRELNAYLDKAKLFLPEVKPENLAEIIGTERDRLRMLENELSRTVSELTEEKAKLELKIKQLNESIKALREAEGSCPLCGAPLSGEKREDLLVAYRRELEAAEKRLQRFSGELERLGRERDEVRRKLEIASSLDLARYEALLGERKKLEERLSLLSRRAERLSALKEAVEKIRGEASKLEEEVTKLRDALSAARRAREELKGVDVSELRRRLEETRSREAQVSADMLKLEYKVRELGGIDQALAKLEQAERRLRELAGIAKLKQRRLEEVEKLRKTVEALRLERETVVEELSKLSFSEEKFKELRERVLRLREKVAGLESRRRGLYESILSEEKRVKELRREYERVLEAERRLGEVRDVLRDLEAIRRAFSKDGAQRLIRDRARPVIERYLKDLASRFDLGFLNLKLTEDFSIRIVDAAGERDVVSASGGEKAALGLALRLALARAVGGQKLGFMMLDEPTQNLDEERRRGLISALRALFGKEGAVFPQLLVVTHNHELEEAADQVFLVEKVGGRSRVRPLER